MKKVVSVQAKENFSLLLHFVDGMEIHVDIGKLMENAGVFAPLQARDFFTQVHLTDEGRSLCWNEDLELDPDVFYMRDDDPRKPASIRTLSCRIVPTQRSA